MSNNEFRTIMKSFRNIGFASHQIKSFNEFIDYRVQKIIDELGEIELETPEFAEFKIKFGKVKIKKPSIKEADGATREITPIEARIRDLTYSSQVFVEMIPLIDAIEQEPQEIKLGEIPIMVKSNLCVLNGMSDDELTEMGEDPGDPGGYFIINGTERVIVMVEEVLSNRPIIERKGILETARINSETGGFVQRHTFERKNGIITITFANIAKLPVVILLKALGIETDKEIADIVSSNEEERQEIYFNLYEFGVADAEQAKDEMGKKLKIPQKEYRDKRVNDILDKYLLPHLGQDKKARREKAEYLGKVMKNLIRVGLRNVKEQDIDHYANKRLRLVGDFLEILFRSILLGKYGLMSRIVYSYQKLVGRGKMPSIKSIVESDYLTKRIISHMATGQWVGGRTGVCQRLERTNYVRSTTHLRNVISPLSSAQEHFEARALHATHWGRLCCEETPEGVNIGLRKYLATMAIISYTASEKDKKTIIELAKKETKGNYTLLLDGKIISVTCSEGFADTLRKKRRSGILDPHIGIAIVNNFEEIHVNTDAGRLERPLIIVENGKSLLTHDYTKKLESGEIGWNDLIKNGIIEYLDAEEEDNGYVALLPSSIAKDHTHLEINPSVILGLPAALVPFAAHNRGDRVNFGAKMCGQSLGVYATNFHLRSDTKSDVLMYSQLPLVNTVAGTELLDLRNHPQGHNIVIAVMSYEGYNMEDGIILNKASIERGFGRSFFFRSYTVEEKKYWGIEKDEIKMPDKTVIGYKADEDYANLAEDGIINREINVVSGDVIVGKISPLRFIGPVESFMTEVENRRETSEVIRYGEDGIVDNVFITETINGNRLVKVKIRNERVPELGDKFASRHGQKGVIALIVPEQDMPFTENGITPDVIINPHAIPSRMTIGQLLEIITAKVSSLKGEYVDATVFSNTTYDGMNFEQGIREALVKLGFRDDGKESMYDGVSGRILSAQILIGPTYYQKLHHMVANKIQSRARGPVALLTKQPTAGRAKQGGLRLGEMEKDCLIAHGAALLLKERFGSDKLTMPLCLSCGLVAVEDRIKGKRYCTICKKSDIADVEMSHAFKLMLDELKCMGIYPRINV
ncbi:MAG: DNA-directed RNA polymerase subunit B [Candidatus Aenigmatarchaeota archaeon]